MKYQNQYSVHHWSGSYDTVSSNIEQIIKKYSHIRSIGLLASDNAKLLEESLDCSQVFIVNEKSSNSVIGGSSIVITAKDMEETVCSSPLPINSLNNESNVECKKRPREGVIESGKRSVLNQDISNNLSIKNKNNSSNFKNQGSLRYSLLPRVYNKPSEMYIHPSIVSPIARLFALTAEHCKENILLSMASTGLGFIPTDINRTESCLWLGSWKTFINEIVLNSILKNSTTNVSGNNESNDSDSSLLQEKGYMSSKTLQFNLKSDLSNRSIKDIYKETVFTTKSIISSDPSIHSSLIGFSQGNDNITLAVPISVRNTIPRDNIVKRPRRRQGNLKKQLIASVRALTFLPNLDVVLNEYKNVCNYDNIETNDIRKDNDLSLEPCDSNTEQPNIKERNVNSLQGEKVVSSEKYEEIVFASEVKADKSVSSELVDISENMRDRILDNTYRTVTYLYPVEGSKLVSFLTPTECSSPRSILSIDIECLIQILLLFENIRCVTSPNHIRKSMKCNILNSDICSKEQYTFFNNKKDFFSQFSTLGSNSYRDFNLKKLTNTRNKTIKNNLIIPTILNTNGIKNDFKIFNEVQGSRPEQKVPIQITKELEESIEFNLFLSCFDKTEQYLRINSLSSDIYPSCTNKEADLKTNCLISPTKSKLKRTKRRLKNTIIRDTRTNKEIFSCIMETPTPINYAQEFLSEIKKSFLKLSHILDNYTKIELIDQYSDYNKKYKEIIKTEILGLLGGVPKKLYSELRRNHLKDIEKGIRNILNGSKVNISARSILFNVCGLSPIAFMCLNNAIIPYSLLKRILSSSTLDVPKVGLRVLQLELLPFNTANDIIKGQIKESELAVKTITIFIFRNDTKWDTVVILTKSNPNSFFCSD